MQVQPLLIELLVSGFFAIACLKARPGDFQQTALSPRDFFRLIPRLERLQRTRWQWFSMVLLLFVIRKQIGVPMAVELTALAQFLIFLALPAVAASTQKDPVGKVARLSCSPATRTRAAVR